MSEVGQLEVRVEPGVDETLVVVDGELDVATVPQLRAAIDAAARHEPRTVVVHARDVRFADATSLGLLVTVSRRLDADGRRLVVRDPSPILLRLFGITRVEEVLEIEQSQEV